MADLIQYLQKISDDLKTLSQDIERIILAKKKKAEQEKKSSDKDQRTSNPQTAEEKKKEAQEQFKRISLKSLQPVTKMYKNKKEIETLKADPEIDFVVKQIEKIFI